MIHQRTNHGLARWLLLAGLLALAACGPSSGDSEETTAAELGTLPGECDSLLDSGADVLAVGAIQDSSGRYLVDTSAGRCTSSQADLLDSVRRRDTHGLTSVLAGKLDLKNNPSPHPDLSGTRGIEPTPHPDVNAPGNTNGDPDPHPDISEDAEDDEVVIIIWIVIVDDEDSTASDSSGQPDDTGDNASGFAQGSH